MYGIAYKIARKHLDTLYGTWVMQRIRKHCVVQEPGSTIPAMVTVTVTRLIRYDSKWKPPVRTENMIIGAK